MASGWPVRYGWGAPVRIIVVLALLLLAGLIVPGFILDAPEPTELTASDAIIVISGDEQMARFREGVRLFREGMGGVLVFSGAAEDRQTSNARVMRQLAVDGGIPPSAVREEPYGEDTWGNATHTRELLEREGLRSAILVTSPYHLRRAALTFKAAYAGSGIRLTAHAAPDSQWRKLSWWSEAETRRLTILELQKLAYITLTGKYN